MINRVLKKFEWLSENEAVITMEVTRQFMWFKPVVETNTWRGGDSVWHDAETGYPCHGTKALSAIYQLAKWRRDDARKLTAFAKKSAA